MSERRKVHVDAKKTQLNAFNVLSRWCKNNGLFVKTNHEIFFVDEKTLMKPDFVVNEKVYIDLNEHKKINEKYKYICQRFSNSYGTIIIIPKENIDEILNVTKKDICERFGITF